MMFLLKLCSIFLVCGFSVMQGAYALDVLDVRVGFNDQTRLVIETNKPVTAKVFTLQNPPRLVVDLPKINKMAPTLSRVDLPPNGIVNTVRDGVFNRTTHRLVLDLKTPVTHKKFTIAPRGQYQNRTVVDLTPRKGANLQANLAPKPLPLMHKPRSFTTQQSQKTRPSAPAFKKDFVVIIDAGHGGVDPGALGKKGTREKDVVLSISRHVVSLLNKKRGIKAHLTRDADTFLKLQQRVDKAKKLKADIFISLHADAHTDRRVRGGSVYVLSESASEREAERLAILINRGVPAVSGLENASRDAIVQDILIDLAQRDTMNNSAFLARSIINQMDNATHMRRKDILFAGFKVLKAPDIPSILVELAYMSHPEEEKKLRTATFQKKLATALTKGVTNYLDSIR